MKKLEFPLIKEHRIKKIFSLLDCFYKYPYDRDNLIESVLRLYPGKTEKSIFRGIAIPTLGKIGLIIGYEDDLRLSCNGMLVYKAKKTSIAEGNRVVRAIILELDMGKMNLISYISQRKCINKNKFIETMISRIESPNKEQAKERIKRWLYLMEETELISIRDTNIKLCSHYWNKAQKDIQIDEEKQKIFKECFFNVYKNVVKEKDIPVVNIEELRTRIAERIYKLKKFLITRKQFDNLLRKISFSTNNYLISLGKSMGYAEALLHWQENYYETMTIRFFNTEEAEK